MSNVQLELPGSDRAILRTAVESIEQQMASLATQTTVDAYRAAATTLAASWGELTKLLALGEAAPLRKCPRCERLGMRTATLCGYCWLKLSPLGPESENASDASPAGAAGEKDQPAAEPVHH